MYKLVLKYIMSSKNTDNKSSSTCRIQKLYTCNTLIHEIK